MKMTYQNKKNNRLATLVSEDKKFKTVILEYTDDKTTVSVTTSTLKRWWKVVEGDNLDEQDKAPQESESSKFGSEKKKAPAKAKSEKKVEPKQNKKDIEVHKEKKIRKKQELPESVVELNQYIFDRVEELGGEVFVPARTDLKMRTFKIGGHMFMKYNFSRNGAVLGCRGAAVTDIKEKPYKIVKHMFDSLYLVDKLDKKRIDTFLKASIKFQETKNAKKEEK